MKNFYSAVFDTTSLTLKVQTVRADGKIRLILLEKSSARAKNWPELVDVEIGFREQEELAEKSGRKLISI